MPGEWKRATWTYDAIGLGHTVANIVNAMHTFLTSCGWERAAWDTSINRAYLRSDRYDIEFVNDNVGAAGNQNITITDPNTRITLQSHMVGGGVSAKAKGSIRFNPLDAFDGAKVALNDGTNPVKTFEIEAGVAFARGRIALRAVPADGDTVVLNDGTNPAITFEFDSNSSVVQTSTLRRVVIAVGDIASTLSNLNTAINDGAITLGITSSIGYPYTVELVNDVAGAPGNVTITSTGTEIFATGMTGGGGAVGVTGGNIAVPRGLTVEETLNNFVSAVNSAANLNVTARWVCRWKFNGDGPWQHCGLHLFNDTVNGKIVLRNFLEYASHVGNQHSTHTSHQIEISYSNTAPNIFTFYGGEDGFFGECGRDGLRVNLAHWLIASWVPIPELFGTDDARVTWTTMGVCMDLFGNLKFSGDRNFRVVDYVQGNRNYSGSFTPRTVRGTVISSASGNGPFDANLPGDDRYALVGSLDSMFGADITGQESDGNSFALRGTFGLLRTPRDGRYRISPMVCFQCSDSRHYALGYSGSPANNIGVTSGPLCGYFRDPRTLRRMPRFAVVDATLIPFTNVVDQRTLIEYYMTQVQDGGRTCNVGIEWTTDVVTIPVSP